jgi:ferric enterobactin receptor
MKNTVQHFFSFVFLFFSLSLFAQKHSLKATLIDSSTNKPVEFATYVLFLEDKPKPLQSGLANDQGKISVENIEKGKYRLEIVMIGFSPKSIKNIDIQKDINLEKILMSPSSNLLNTVNVTAQKPIIEQSGDKLIYNVENDFSIQGNNALELLKKIPYVTVDNDDNIQLKGQSNFIVQMNGRSTGIIAKNPKDALKGLPANLIKKVEVITNPGAKYDADGTAGIINIITNKKIAGYNGNLGASYSSLNSLNLNGNFSIKNGKLGISGYLGRGKSRNIHESMFWRQNLVPSTFSRQEQNGNGKNQSEHLYTNLELAYDIDSLKSVSIYGNYNNGFWNSQSNSSLNFFNENKQIYQSATRSSAIENYWPGYEFGFDYTQKFKKEDQEWTISINEDRDKGSGKNTNNFDYSFGNKDRFLKYTNQNNEKTRTFQSDFIYPVKKDQTLSFGAKSVSRSLSTDYIQELRDTFTEQYIKVNENSNVFDYSQKVASSYVSYATKIKKVTITPGFRFEHTSINGSLRVGNNPPFKNTYPSYIPTFSMNYVPKIGKTLRLAYSRRLQRPSLWYLNPYNDNSDPRNITYGNPSLNPEYTHQAEASFSFMTGGKTVQMSVQQGVTNNAINSYGTVNSSTGVLTTTYANLGKTETTSLSIFSNGMVGKKFNYNGRLGANYNHLSGQIGLKTFDNKGWTYNANAYLTYNATKKTRISANAYVGTGRIQLQGFSNGWWNYSTTFSQSLLKGDALRINLSADNFFHKNRNWESSVKDAQFETYSISYNPFRAFRLGANYRFGKLKENVSRKKGVDNSDQKSGGSNN